MRDSVRSPLTGTNRVRVVETLSTTDLIHQWQQAFNIDISDELQSVKRIRRFQCIETGLEFYYPHEAAGSGELYESLQKLDWYYMPHKWEHDAAASDINDGDRVLEVGCGEGAFVEWLRREKGADVEGIELNERAVTTAQRKDRPVEKSDLLELATSRPESYDVVCSFQVLEHILEVRPFIEASIKALRPGGKLIFGVPNSGGFIKHAEGDLLNQPPHHMTRWSEKVFRYLPSLFNIKISQIKFEPLAKYHVNWYINIQKNRLKTLLPESKVFDSVFNRVSNNIISPIISYTKMNKNINGHTIYACFEKANK